MERKTGTGPLRFCAGLGIWALSKRNSVLAGMGLVMTLGKHPSLEGSRQRHDFSEQDSLGTTSKKNSFID